MPRVIRSFLAFEIDSEAVLKKLANVQALLLKTEASLKLVKPKNIHVTMRFLGNIALSIVENIFEEMKKVQFSSFDIKVQGVGVFPHLRHPRVVWAGITEGAEHIRNIYNQLEPRLRMLGFAPDPKGFSPHLTIARVKSGKNKAELADYVKENLHLEFGIVRVECLKLKRSNLTPIGPVYSTLKEFCPE